MTGEDFNSDAKLMDAICSTVCAATSCHMPSFLAAGPTPVGPDQVFL